MAQDGTSRLASLLLWFEQHGVRLKDADIRSVATKYSGDAWGVFASKTMPEGAQIATIPKKAVLSVKNSQASDFLEENKIGGDLLLCIRCRYTVAANN